MDSRINEADVRATIAQSMVIGLEGPEPTNREYSLVGDTGLGGVILFSRNIESPAQVWSMNYRMRQAAGMREKPPLLVMVDQEGGSVARLHAPFVDGPDLCDMADKSPEDLYEHGRRIGAQLFTAGFNFNLAPVVDAHAIPGGIMARRSLGQDPAKVGKLAAAFIRGQQSAGCLACAKHFPGLGRTTADSHKDRPLVSLAMEELKDVELPPFRAAIEAGVAGVMVCHAVFQAIDPDNPASISEKVIGGVLRGELGYAGLVISDDMEMGALAAQGLTPAEAAVKAYLAGCDLILMCHTPDAALEALERLTDMVMGGEVDPMVLREKASRILAAKKPLSHNPPHASELMKVLA